MDDKNLPFDGQAMPVGNDLFVSHSRTSAAAATAIYYIKVLQSKLLVQELL